MKLLHDTQTLKLAILPALTLRTWFALWGIAMAVMLANWAGPWLGWFDSVRDISIACPIAFLLLALTPLDCSRRIHFMGRRSDAQPNPWMPMTKREALAMRADPHWEVVRLVVIDGKVREVTRA